MASRAAASNVAKTGGRCSVIVPTWNEESWLPRLLGALRHSAEIEEIIIADNSSTDQTLAIAREFGCRCVPGGLPAQGRNRGAAAARADVLVFLDADVVVPDGAFARAISILSTTPTVLVHFPLRPLTSRRFVLLCYRVMHLWLRLLNYTPVKQGVAGFLAMRKADFERIGGFNEKIAVGEDADFVRRAGRIGPIEYDSSFVVQCSPRRFRVENPLGFALKTVLWAVLRLTRTQASLLPYKWQRYPGHFVTGETEILRGAKH